MENATPKAPGLIWATRKGGQRVPYWIASKAAIAAGYPLKTVNLSSLAATPPALIARANRLQAEMLQWMGGAERDALAFDGTLGAVLRVYQTHPDSSYRRLAARSRRPYDVYLRRLHDMVGGRRVDRVIGLDVLKWHEVWRAPDIPGGPEKLGAASMALAVLKAALSFGALCGLAGCAALRDTLKHARLPGPRPRTQAPTATAIVLARQAAHAAGRPSRALAYALQFETLLRQSDVIGRWLPLSDPAPSAVIHGGRKWVGLTWADISDDLVLRLVPSKTAHSSGATVTINLKSCPMVLDELPAKRPVGSVIVAEHSGRPYSEREFNRGWRADAATAGLPAKLWNRDLRAGGVTEGRRGGGDLHDAAKSAGHSRIAITGRVYDRDQVEAHRRFAAARKAARDGEGG